MTAIAAAAVLGFGLGYGTAAALAWLDNLLVCWRMAYLHFASVMESAA
jgi:hypothetical protein